MITGVVTVPLLLTRISQMATSRSDVGGRIS
jgi:hypothetical protein